MTYKIAYAADPSPEDIQILGDGINSYNVTKVRGGGRQYLTFFLYDADGSIIGGVHGNTGWGWLYISDLWVSEQVRGGGYGSALMQQAEQEALQRGCANAYLDTFSFQAVEFYQKLGYTIFGELEDFPQGHKRCLLRKRLAGPQNPDGGGDV
jgi:GNAT superfamily N-acetyltransferase